ncbi:MAG: phosphoserine phosphatase SerB [Hyphomicrobiaceae bacterium]
MHHAFCLTLCSPAGRPIGDAALGIARAAVAPGTVLGERWLAPDEAWELRFTAEGTDCLAPVRDTVAAAVDGADVNIISDELQRRRKRLLVADMESTIIEQEMLDELAGEIGLRDKVAGITERAMRGELDFEAAITERVALLEGLDAGVLDRMAAERITYMPGARELVATMKANGAYCALVSGGFTCFTGPVAKALGFDEHQANTLEIRNGRLTGSVSPPILGRETKLSALLRLCEHLGIDTVHSLAVGDGANDLAMLGAAGLGVAFRAKPKVREAAAAMPNGAVVTYADLTALLHLQGYSVEEIRTGR